MHKGSCHTIAGNCTGRHTEYFGIVREVSYTVGVTDHTGFEVLESKWLPRMSLTTLSWRKGQLTCRCSVWGDSELQEKKHTAGNSRHETGAVDQNVDQSLR